MTLLYSKRFFLNHETGLHPERADRIRLIPERLRATGLDQRCERPKWKHVSRQRLTRVHSPSYVDEVWAMAKSGGGDIEPDTVVSPDSYDVALQAAGALCNATKRLVQGEDTQALCLVRPPGHHALTGAAMGFCLFNNIAVAAKMATDELGLDRVLIVDWDVHHGNGTQATFWEDPRVWFLSIHRWPFYPGTGHEEETGSGRGLGTTLNLPVPFGIRPRDYLTLFANALERFAAKCKPQLVLVSAGFDSHYCDPIGNLGLDTGDFATLTETVLDVADSYADGKLVSTLEGGYAPDALTDCVEVHLSEMVKRAESVRAG